MQAGRHSAPRHVLNHDDVFATSGKAVLSPCIGVCELDDKGLCRGCHRNSAEIARWSIMGDDERRRIMLQVIAEREASRA